jgi:predicted nucleic acid-binding protein
MATLIEHTRVETDRQASAAGLAMREAGGAFSDGCLLQEADRRRCETVLTFDKRFVARSNGRATLMEAD